MRTKQTHAKARSTIAIGALIGLFAVLPGCSFGWGNCVEVDGPFTASLLPPEECDSPVGFCTSGKLTGAIEGTYSFVMTSSEPAPTPEHPTREVFTGVSTITTAMGSMYGEDHGEIWFDGDSGFITFIGVVDGEQCYTHATGEIVAYGELDLNTGESVGFYTGTVCAARPCFGR